MEHLFGSTPILNIIFLILSLIGLALAIVSINISRKIKRPVFNYRSFNLINSEKSNVPNLSVQIGNMEIKTLTLTQIAFWNQGKDVINSVDVAPLSPLRVVCKNCEIVSSEITYTSSPTNNFSLVFNKQECKILFDYIANNVHNPIKLTQQLRRKLTHTFPGKDFHYCTQQTSCIAA
jgi:hypothetical protein